MNRQEFWQCADKEQVMGR